MMSTAKRGALFLDFDNFAIEFEKNDAYIGVRDGLFFPQLLIHFLEKSIDCSLIQKKAYGEFNLHTNRIFKDRIWSGAEIREIVSQDREQRDWLMKSGFEFVYCPTMTESKDRQKNGADIELCIDVVSTAATRPDIDVFFIASGDTDMIGTCRRLRAQGKHVVLVVLNDRSSARYADIVSSTLCFGPREVQRLTCGPLDDALMTLGQKGIIEQSVLRAEIQRLGFEPRLAGHSWASYFNSCLDIDDWYMRGDGRICSTRMVAEESQSTEAAEFVVGEFLRGWDLRNTPIAERLKVINAARTWQYVADPPTLRTLMERLATSLSVSKTRVNTVIRILKHADYFLDAEGKPVEDLTTTQVHRVADISPEQLRWRLAKIVGRYMIERTDASPHMFTESKHAALFARATFDRDDDSFVKMVTQVFTEIATDQSVDDPSEVVGA